VSFAFVQPPSASREARGGGLLLGCSSARRHPMRAPEVPALDDLGSRACV